MKTLQNVWGKLNFGDLLLVQIEENDKIINEPQLITIVGMDIYDMAFVIHYVDYKSFNQWNNLLSKNKMLKKLEIKTFNDWSDIMYILGYWKKMPSFKNLLNSYRKKLKK